MGQVKNILWLSRHLANPSQIPRCARFCSLRCAKGRILDPQKFDCVRMPRSGILSPLRMTQDGHASRCVLDDSSKPPPYAKDGRRNDTQKNTLLLHFVF